MFAAWEGATRGGVMMMEETARLVVSKAEETCGRTFPLFVGFFWFARKNIAPKAFVGAPATMAMTTPRVVAPGAAVSTAGLHL